MNRPRIRAFEERDWPMIWPFFRDIAAAQETYTYPPDITEDFARAIWLAPAPAHTVVAVDDEDRVLGTAKMGPNQMGPGSHVATASYMVDPAHQGRGIGRALGKYSLDWARGQGYRGMQFNAVVSTNAPAVALWQAIGFAIVGTVPGAFRRANGDYADLYVMHQAL